MTITFYSNFLNDHQLPFCQEIISRIGENNFHFVAHRRMDPDRVAMGFADMNEIYPFVIKAFESGSSLKYAQHLMLESDVVIIGSFKDMPFAERMRSNKLTFRYNERLLKRGYLRWLDPRVHLAVYKNFGRYRSLSSNLYVLCASAYTAKDLSLFGFPKRKCYKWGYFPVVKMYDHVDELLLGKQQKKGLKHCQDVSILWVARLIGWKHPEMPIMVAKRLKADGYSFRLDMIGIGEKHAWIEKLIADNDVADCVRLLGGMPPAEVRQHMEKCDIFLFTSDKNEGWGAVLNESMNSACAVVANKAIGSVPFLIEDGENGFAYEDGNVDDLYAKIRLLVEDPQLRREMGMKAYRTMIGKWNASNAAENLLLLIESLRERNVGAVVSGPCSLV